MSDRLPYPRDAQPSPEGMLASLQDVLRVVRQVFFPRTGKNLVQRVEELERRVAALENAE